LSFAYLCRSTSQSMPSEQPLQQSLQSPV